MASRKHALRFFRNLLLGMAAILIAASAWIWFAPCWLGGCAPLDDLAEYQAEGSTLLDVHGKPFGTLATVNRRIVSLDSLPPHVPRAFLAVEDQRFFEHSGIDIRRVFGALLSNVKAGGVAEGGSTISMQLARNLFPEWLPYQERSMRRKLMEARVARQIERRFSKEKILELYLNHIYLGEGAYGIEAAARAYFDKPASELTLTEAAVLGGLPKAPSSLNPVVDREAARKRRDLVLQEMAQAQYISAEEAERAQQEPIRLAKGDTDDGELRGSYFVERVRRELEETLGSRLYTSGLKIHTTLDPTVQRAAEEELAKQLDAIEAGRFGTYRHPTYPETKGVAAETGETPYLQGAVIVLDANSGEVRALVGGRDFEDSKFDRATQALRQPGSAFKPFVYAAALQRYGSPVQQVQDAPLRMVLDGGTVWEPKNYTGRYEGPMTLRDALAQSKNTVTVRVAQDVGMPSVIELARDLGVENEIPAVPSAALGAAEVHPIELARAYATFANGGYRVEPTYIQKVVDRRGRTIWESEPRRKRVMDPGLAFVLTSMLQDVVNRGTGTAVRSAGYRGPAAGKTGTTNEATDVWFLGYTPELVGAVWMGLDEPQTIVSGASGGTLAAPVWGRILARTYRNKSAPAAWSPPAGVTTAEVERGTGRVLGEDCAASGPTYTEYFLAPTPIIRDCLPPRRLTSGYPDETEEDDTGYSASADDRALSDSGFTWPEGESGQRSGQDGVTTEPWNNQSSATGTGDRATEPQSGTSAAASREEQDRRGRESAESQSSPRENRGSGESQQPRKAPKLLGTPIHRDRKPPTTPPDSTTADGGSSDSQEQSDDSRVFIRASFDPLW